MNPQRLGLERWLEEALSQVGAVAGTVHLRSGEQLELAAAVGIPPPVVGLVMVIPKGKGMAGLAWVRGQPVSTCNLRSDPTADIQPGARAVSAKAASAIPVFAPDGSLRAVTGFAFDTERVFGPVLLKQLETLAQHTPNGKPHQFGRN